MFNHSSEQLLEEIYKSAKMGMQATKQVAEKTENNSQRADINRQNNMYHRLAESAGERLAKNGQLPGENSVMEKAALWGSIQMNTLTGVGPSKISEIMINGCNMGIVDITKKMNDCRDADSFSQKLGQEFIKHSEENIENMKAYL